MQYTENLKLPKVERQDQYDVLTFHNEAMDILDEAIEGLDLTGYQEKTDEALTTTDKTIVGAINEVEENKLESGGYEGTAQDIMTAMGLLSEELESKQEILVSGENIKTINGESLIGTGNITVEDGKIKVYDNISDMKQDTTLTNGSYVKVLGYYSKFDGCIGELEILPAGSFSNLKHEGGLWFTLANGLNAKWVLENTNHISIRQLGGRDWNINFDNTPAFLRARQLEGWVIDFPYITNGIYYLAGNRPVDGDKPLEAGFYYNPLDERVVIKMEDMTPSYLGNKSDPKTFLGVINPIKFEFTHQNGKNMIIGKNAVIEESFLSNAPKTKHSKKELIEINFNDGSWSGYNTSDYVADGSLNVSLVTKQLKWTANNPTVSRLGMVRKFNDNDLFEVACVRKTTDNVALYAYFVEKGTNNSVWLRIPLFGDTKNQIEWYYSGNPTTLKKVSTFDVTMGGKTADYFKIPVGGSMSLGLMKNGKDLFLYLNGVFIDKYTHTTEIDRIGVGNANASMTTIEFWQPVVYKNSDIDSSRQLKVYCLGDSNTFGSRVTMRWADYLPYISRQFEGLGDVLVTTVNATVDISSGGVGLPDFSGNDYVVVMLGTNDSRVDGDNVTIGETYNTNMTALINKIIADEATPIICTFAMLFDGTDTGQGYFLPYTFKSGYLINRIKTTCAQLGVEVAEVRNFLSNNWDKFYSDALHYTNPAHLEISKAVCDAISRSITPKEINTTTRVSFNGTNGTIYKDYNVKSVTRTSQGKYKIDFVHPMKDVNYTLIGMTSNDGSIVPCIVNIDRDTQTSPKTLTSCYVCVNNVADTNLFIDNIFVDLIFL